MNFESLSAIATLLSALATLFMVHIFREQLKQEWRAVPVIIRPPLNTTNEESTNLREKHLLLKNLGGGPALNVSLYLAPNEFEFKVEKSPELKLSRPLAPNIMYEVQIIGVKTEEAEKNSSISDKVSFNKKFNESEEVIPALVFESDQVIDLPNDINAVITFEDINRQKRWVKYTGEGLENAKQTYGEEMPGFLKQNSN
ncbi:hypothetical protein [Acetohalobium arabaticum]|uniref:Uncharacterized protein n=1 Tax=Acetohalobium arabaticum (strain ATCC 49924 / DSM 5501 / Z-7288) TaxID=574087 RepID=D9QPQ7_ACEAZ|nr:hypothetical protein [Acetohalobium arabaticum]ADL12498.1 hypothetical protein Acear_0968 [Acetohalobium arabaticum DSM 5501]